MCVQVCVYSVMYILTYSPNWEHSKLGMTPKEADSPFERGSLISSFLFYLWELLSQCFMPPLLPPVSLCLSGALYHIKEPLHPLRSCGSLGIDVALKELATGPLRILALPDSSWCM